MMLAREGLHTKLRSAIHKAVRENGPVTLADVQVKRNGGYYPVIVTIRPVQGPAGADGLLLVTVQDFGRPKSAMITFKVSNRTDTPVTYTIDCQTCTASPGYTITYERSRPPELRFPWSDKVKVTEAASKVFHPASGATYTIRTTEGDAVTVDSIDGGGK
jgi:hypothetical protein